MPNVHEMEHYSREFGVFLRRFRKSAGLTQEQLAERAGLACDTVRRVESAAFSHSLETLFKLARGFGSTPGQLLNAFEGVLMTSGEAGMLATYRRSDPLAREAMQGAVAGISRVHEHIDRD